MDQHAEIVSRFDALKDCAGLLYAPMARPLQYRRTRCYRFTFEGDGACLVEFIRETLVDEVSQELVLTGAPALQGFRFCLDFGMKRGVLDLEKEAILNYYRELESPDFEISSLELVTRIYVFGEDAAGDPSGVFVRDIVNPAIHTWSVRDARSCA